jgi:hypothetical protein
MVASILAASNDIVEVAEDNECTFESVRRVSEVSESLWAEIKALPVIFLPSIHSSVEKYQLYGTRLLWLSYF